MRCVICDTMSKPLFRINGHTIHACPKCGHQMIQVKDCKCHVSDIFADTYFFGGGAGYPDYLTEKNILVNQGRYYGKILHRYLPTGASVLDVGAAAGFIMQGLVEEGLRVQGVEPNKSMAEHACRKLGLTVILADIESYTTDQQFDAVCLIQVIAHFCDPGLALAKCMQLLKTQGFIIVETWNRESLTARLFGRHWHEYSPPSVCHWFSREGLDALFGRFNCTKVATGRRCKRITLVHALELINHKLKQTVFFRKVRLPQGLLPAQTTFPYPSEDLFWTLYQKR